MSFLGIAFLIFVLVEVVAVFVGLYFQRHPEKHKKLVERSNQLMDKLHRTKDRDIWVP